MTSRTTLVYLLPIAASLGVAVAQQPVPPAGQPPAGTPPQQQSNIEVRLTGDPGTPPRLAVPDFLTLSPDRETQEMARLIAEVLWADLEYEREFYMIPRDTYKSIPPAPSIADPPLDRWRELGADGVLMGTVAKTTAGVRVVIRLFRVASRQQILAREYTGSGNNPRLFAHTVADEVHETQRSLRGVARTKLAFSSDRDGTKVVGTVEKREVKEVYVADYDGANQRRITADRQLSITPSWAPDGRAIAFTSYRRGFPDIYIATIFQATPPTTPTRGAGHNFLPVFSPDGTRIAFASNRDGNPEIYIMNRDGSNVRRLTNHPAIDFTPTWSPNGMQIAFTSDRSGQPSIWVVGTDGLSLRRVSFEISDRPTWSPAPYNEIAFSARTGPGYDIKVLNIAAGETKQITFGEGSNESPAWSPNGRHLAFSSTRAGFTHIFTVDRDGRNVRQITRQGNNQQPHWSQ